MFDEDERHHRLEHWHVDFLPNSCSLLVQESSQNRIYCCQARHLVCKYGWNIGRSTDKFFLQAREPACRLDGVIIGCQTGIPAVSAESEQIAVHNRGFRPGDAVVAQPKTIDRLRPHRMKKDVASTCQVNAGISACRILQVENDTFLASVERGENSARSGLLVGRNRS